MDILRREFSDPCYTINRTGVNYVVRYNYKGVTVDTHILCERGQSGRYDGYVVSGNRVSQALNFFSGVPRFVDLIESIGLKPNLDDGISYDMVASEDDNVRYHQVYYGDIEIEFKINKRMITFYTIDDFEDYIKNEYGRSYDIPSKFLQFAD
jgi:hypothetical protein